MKGTENMKKLTAVILCLILLFSLASCGKVVKSVGDPSLETTISTDSTVKLNYDPQQFAEVIQAELGAGHQIANAYVSDVDGNGIPEVGYNLYDGVTYPAVLFTEINGEIVYFEHGDYKDYSSSGSSIAVNFYYCDGYIVVHEEGVSAGTCSYNAATVYRADANGFALQDVVTAESLGLKAPYEIEVEGETDYDAVENTIKFYREGLFDALKKQYNFNSETPYYGVSQKEDVLDYLASTIRCTFDSNAQVTSVAADSKFTDIPEKSAKNIKASQEDWNYLNLYLLLLRGEEAYSIGDNTSAGKYLEHTGANGMYLLLYNVAANKGAYQSNADAMKENGSKFGKYPAKFIEWAFFNTFFIYASDIADQVLPEEGNEGMSDEERTWMYEEEDFYYIADPDSKNFADQGVDIKIDNENTDKTYNITATYTTTAADGTTQVLGTADAKVAYRQAGNRKFWTFYSFEYTPAQAEVTE